MITFRTFILWLHLAGIAVWAGGLFILPFVSVPALMSAIDSPTHAARLAAMMIRRFQTITWKLILFIALTGIFNLMISGVSQGFDFGDSYLRALLMKLSLLVVVVTIQAWQSYRLGPAFASTTEPEAARRFYRRYLLTSILNLFLVAAVILLGLKLRSG